MNYLCYTIAVVTKNTLSMVAAGKIQFIKGSVQMAKLGTMFFVDVGKILKMIAVPILPAGVAVFLLSGLYMLSKKETSQNEKYLFFGIVLIVAAIVVPLCLFYLVYGFGDLIDKVNEIEKHLQIN